MQINVALENNSDEQAEIIRKKWYKTTTAQQTRDAFIFNECVDRFSGEPEDLIPYIGKDEGSTIVQRRLTIKSAIIAYTIDNLPTTEDNENMAEPVGVSQLLMEKIALLEKQMEACNQTLKEIKELTK